MRHFRVAVLLAVMLTAQAAHAIDLSLDAASPQIPAPVANANNIVAAYTLALVITGAQLGLLAGEDETSFSYGYDFVIPPVPGNHATLYYSVTRGTAGLAGSPVAAQVALNGAAGDIFSVLFNPNPNPPALFQDAVPLALTPLPPVESNMDGLDMGQNGVIQGVFFNPV